GPAGVGAPAARARARAAAAAGQLVHRPAGPPLRQRRRPHIPHHRLQGAGAARRSAGEQARRPVMSFKPGDIVDITIEGARVRAIRGEDIVDHLSYEIQGFVASVALTESVTVERVALAEWPPRPGDVWLDAEGRAWTALRGRMFPVTSARGESADAALAIYGPL